MSGPRTYFSLKFAAFAFFVTLVAPAAGCREDTPIRIGYVGGLTGRTADLGLAGRDGALLAIEQINEGGGIGGRRVELVVRDDRQEPETARRVVQELLDGGVFAIIGPMTSEMALAVTPLANQAGRVLLSPTASTDRLSGLQDYFFRIYPTVTEPAAELAKVARMQKGATRVAVVYDVRNRSHTEAFYRTFAETFKEAGGKIVAAEVFSSGTDGSLFDLARRLSETDSDAYLFATSAMDTAILCQQLEKFGTKRPVFTSEWSATDDLIAFGGKTVEGVTFFQSFDRSSSLPSYIEFRKSFVERFRAEPRFASVHGYDAARILLSALAGKPDPQHLPEKILSKTSYAGVQTSISFTAAGDARRPLFLTTVRNGHFALVPPP